MRDADVERVMETLREAVKQWKTPAVTVVARDRDPFRVLVSCILSLRTQDRTTEAASLRLFGLADTPERLARLPVEEVERAIYPVGFYRNKAAGLIELSRTLVERYGGKVPDDLDELLALKGVGRKTANLVVTLGFGKPGICVDVHVHRICNRLGYIATKTPEETETVLRAKLPPHWWIDVNDILVTFGQNQCTPVSPRCSTCPVAEWCDRVGVTASR